MEINIYEAKNNLSELVKRVEQGEEVILSRHGRPVVQMVKLPPKIRELGLFRSQIKEVDPDWWKPMTDEEAEAFYRGDY
jgi:antitoxin (DNA-binding transcriptional repressor) of toxin-antitoxin stability system